jgi:hypothetical protein
MRRSVRRVAWIGVVAGTIAAACGLAVPFAPLAAIGLVIACAGAWNLWRPSLAGMVVDGVTMILTGAFNCLAWLWLDETRATAVGRWIFAGVVQIVWGIRRLVLYRTARFTRNDPQAIARLETIVRELAKRNVKDDRSVAEFLWQAGTAYGLFGPPSERGIY